VTVVQLIALMIVGAVIVAVAAVTGSLEGLEPIVVLLLAVLGVRLGGGDRDDGSRQP
jgi:hypothetical protein